MAKLQHALFKLFFIILDKRINARMYLWVSSQWGGLLADLWESPLFSMQLVLCHISFVPSKIK